MTDSVFRITQDLYNEKAAHFAQHFERKLDTTELDIFLSDLPDKASILDAGCGSARDAAYMIKKGYKAEGIDLSTGLLAEAKKLHPEVPTQIMSLTEISFPNGTFDGVWCKAAILHLERSELPAVLHAFHRILKPNGKLFIQTKAGTGEGDQAVPFDSNLKRHFTFYSLEELKQAVIAAGFEITNETAFNSKQRQQKGRDQEWVAVSATKI